MKHVEMMIHKIRLYYRKIKKKQKWNATRCCRNRRERSSHLKKKLFFILNLYIKEVGCSNFKYFF